MPSYTFICIACKSEAILSMPITEAPGIGTEIMIEEETRHCKKCGGEVFERVWGKTSAPFKFNMRRTSL